MSLEELLEQTPAYAKDLKLNFSSLVRNQTELSTQQLWGTIVASSIASRNPDLTQAALADASSQLLPQALDAAKSAAAVMGMNNVYYRFTHLTKNEKYATLPARLRMNAMRAHGIEQVDFELWCTAVSAINGCGVCIDSHEQVIRQKGLTEDHIAAAIRVAAVVHALACVFDAERAAQTLTAAAS